MSAKDLAPTNSDYSQLDPALAVEIRDVASCIRDLVRASVIEVGRELLAIKDRLDHGQFFGLVEVGMSPARHCRHAPNAGGRRKEEPGRCDHPRRLGAVFARTLLMGFTDYIDTAFQPFISSDNLIKQSVLPDAAFPIMDFTPAPRDQSQSAAPNRGNYFFNAIAPLRSLLSHERRRVGGVSILDLE